MAADVRWWAQLAGEIRAASRGDLPIEVPLRAVRDELGFDCVALVACGLPRAGGTHTALVNLGYTAETLAYITTTYSRTCPVHRLAVRRGTPLRFVDVPFDLRETRTYREAILPNRFREGMTLPLAPPATGAAIPGFVAMSSTHATPLDDESRLALMMLSRDLAGLIDPGAEAGDIVADVVLRITHDLVEIRAGELGEVPLTSAELHLAVRSAAASAAGHVGFHHRAADGTWWHVRAVRHPGAVLVRFGRVPAFGRLTSRELDVVGLVARGWSNERISQALGIAVRTVRSHVESSLIKLDCPNRTALARTAFERELDTVDALRVAHH
ncbi:Autoinducer binding domain-containing protein [Saccharopolyspora antimicrobica]|uniref:Autoinducer binding domain-containing protein n=1 Tax=Saccharopolyspora antimicrobica TaxID=455193 RepID=A0A1I4VY81_9PSEU|nr:LuxR C-terminal-related transcriptional regulator [Saccharopolyspora antimicrobica]RKT87150.1 autoinducer binding domain-containing protein [Saccharopolyspora antimicrobica]SFN06258.1 Autoinducer binding domain-containing protein [Saccharopolyspora antimicrobica]